MRKVEVMSFNERWGQDFEEEAVLLQKIFGEEMFEIHHIGSTSVHGLSAKPIIDILPVVKDISQVDRYNANMTAIGYEAKGENGIAGRRYFQKGGNERTHHVHIYEKGSSEIDRHLAFRDFLRAHPEKAKAYGDLKEKLAQQFPFDIESYIKGKERLASKIEQEAVVWYLGAMEKGKPQLQIHMESPLIDRSVGISVTGLSGGQKVTVRFQRNSYWGSTIYLMESHGTYMADEYGVVDLQKASPIEGTYEGIDGMGLFWSMQVKGTEVNSEEVFNKLQPHTLTILLESDGKVIDTKVITRKWIADDILRTPVNEKGVVGTFFHTGDSSVRPTVIVVGGSEGGIYEFPASLLASRGFNVLALGYWGQEPLPKQLVEIPLEYIEGAIHWLKARPDVAKGWLGMHGTSKGGELSLLAAAHFEEIKAVVSLSGSPVVCCGIVPWTEQKELPPAWTYKGKAIPYARPDNSVEVSNKCLSMRKAGENPLRIWYDYLTSDPQITEQATIPVEKINGSILLISGTDDACFDSVRLNERAMDRLGRFKFENEYNHHEYEGAGHEVGIPFISVSASKFTGGNKYDTAQASRDSWEKTVEFFWRSVSELKM
jgi:GrpB-like predicted nucleotidyltransferase (UPF0157 family)/dienelactone hydrolase